MDRDRYQERTDYDQNYGQPSTAQNRQSAYYQQPYQQQPQQQPTYRQQSHQQGGNPYQQQSSTIQNPQTGQLPQVKGPQMNDRDRLNDLLATEKYLTDSLNVFAREASHRQLHQDTMNMVNDCHQQARELFNLMFQKGWYKMQAENAQQISQAFQKFSGYLSQFPQGEQTYTQQQTYPQQQTYTQQQTYPQQ